MLKILKIKGKSMEPALQNGDFVLVAKFPFLLGLKAGRWVVFSYADSLYVKEVVRVDKDSIRVRGLNPMSMTEAAFGNIKKTAIVGVVIKVFHDKAEKKESKEG